MRPQIIMPKGVKSALPSILQNPPQQRAVQPKTVDNFMDKVVDVKNLAGQVIFTGTPRQWQRWAHQKETETRASFGLSPRTRVLGKKSPSGKPGRTGRSLYR